MNRITPQIRVLFGRSRAMALLLVFRVFLISVTTLTLIGSRPQTAYAATNSNLNFQARLQTNTGGIVPDGYYNIQFNLYDVSTGGTSLWTETYLNSASQGVRVKNGYVTANLGNLTAFPDTINWDQDLWLGMTVRGTGSCAFGACTPTDAEMSPRLKLTGVPYAFRAGMLATGNGTLQSTLQILQPTGGSQVFQIADQGAAGTYTLLTQNAANANYIQNGTSAQTANFNITGNGTIGGNLAVTGTYNGNTFDSTTLTFGGAASTISSAAAQSLTLDSGTTGALNIGTGASAKTIQLGTATGAVAQTINIGNNATAASTTTLNLGSAVGTSTTTIRAGTGGISIGNAGVANTLQFGNTTGAVAQTINIGNNATAASTTTLTLGSTIGTSTTNIRSGSGGVAVTGNTSITGNTTSRTTTNSANAFQVQNNNQTPIFGVGTVAPAANLITNPGFEVNTTGWSAKGTATVPTRITTPATALYYGIAAGQLTTGTAANNGHAFTVSQTLGTTYNLSFYARASTGTATGISFGYTNTGGDVDCSTGNSIPSTGFTRFSCSYTVTGTAGTAIYLKQTGTTSQVIYIDGFQLLAGASNAVPYSLGTLQLRGAVDSPVAFQNSNNSTTAFQIQNSAGNSNLFVADTLNDRIGIGVGTPGYKLDVSGDINSSTGFRVGGTAGSTTTCSGGQFLQNAVITGGIVTGGACAAASSGGVTTVGTFSSTSIANGASISGNTITLGVADGTNPGMLSTTAQTIAGDKTFSNNLVVGGTYNTNTFTGASLTFGSTAAASIQSASNQDLTVDSGGTGALNLGTGVSAKTIQIGTTTGAVAQTINIGNNATASSQTTLNIGSTIGASATNIRAGTGRISLEGPVDINVSGSGATRIGTAVVSTGAIQIGNNSNTLAIASSNFNLTTAGAVSNITSLGAQSINLSGNFTQSNVANTFTTGQGAAILRNNTIDLGDATTDRVTFTAQVTGASPLVFQGATNDSFATTLALVDPTANNTITLPNQSGTVAVSSNAGTTGQCLKSNGGGTTAASYSACGTASTLQDVYDGSGAANPQITLSSTNGGLKVRDGSTPVTGNMLQFQNNAMTATYFGVSASATTLQNSSGVKTVELLNSGELRIYDPASFNAGNYASVTYSGNVATFAASTGTTRVGNGSGNISLTLSNVADVLTATKTATLSAAYNATDYSFTRTLTAGSNVLSGSVMSVESLSTGTNISSTILRLNENNSASTGNLIVATTGGAGNDKFKVNTGGTVTIAAGQSYTGAGALTVSSGSGNLTLQAAGANATIVKAATDSTNTFSVQDAGGNADFQIDTANGQFAFGANGLVTGARLGIVGFGSLNILQLNNGGGTQVFTVDSTGDTLIKPSANAVNAFQVQNTSSANMFLVDSTNNHVEIGSSTTDATAILLVLDSYNVATDPTNNAVNGAMYYNSSRQQFRCYRDGAWEPCATKPIDRAYIIEEEFMSGSTGLTNGTIGIGNFNWMISQITNVCTAATYGGGTGAAVTGDRPGIYRMTTAATGSGYGCRIGLGPVVNTALAAGQTFKTSVAVDSAASIALRTGLTQETTGAVTSALTTGVWWEADTSQSSNWRYCFGTGSGATCASSGVAIAANTFVRLEARIMATGTGASAATFVINGTSFNVSAVTIATTNLVRPVFGCNTLAALARNCSIDYFLFRGDTAAAR